MIFESRSAAYDMMREFAPQSFCQAWAQALLPVAAVTITDDRNAKSFVGGQPKAGPDVTWPTSHPFDDRQEVLDVFGTNEADYAQAMLDAQTPYSFIAQIELSDLRKVPDMPALPQVGRLLFFYDHAIGPYGSVFTGGHVIWDRAPSGNTLPYPDALKRAEDKHLSITEIAADPDYTEIMVEYARQTDPNFDEAKVRAEYAKPIQLDPQPLFVTPRRSVELDQKFVPITAFVLERDAHIRSLPGENLRDTEAELYEWENEITDRQEEMGLYDPSFLGGVPVPVQDDPRYDPVREVIADDDEGIELETVALQIASDSWVLLAQISLSTVYGRDEMEGILYYLIHRDDLAAQNFDDIATVYQQT